MFWQDVLLGCRVPDTVLRKALATVLGIPAPRVRIVDRVSDTLEVDNVAAPLIVERTTIGGEFPLHVSLYVNDRLVAQSLQSFSASVERLARLSEQVHCAALVSDDSLDPASWLRIQPSGLVERVMLDSARLDRDEYVVASAAPVDLWRGSAV